MYQILKNIFGTQARQPRTAARTHRPRSVRPRLEALERRDVPAPLAVQATLLNGVLHVEGTDAADVIQVQRVTQTADSLKLTYYGMFPVWSRTVQTVQDDIVVRGRQASEASDRLFSFRAGDVREIQIDGWAGDDRIDAGAGTPPPPPVVTAVRGPVGYVVTTTVVGPVSAPTTIRGEDGADRIFGGAGDDTLYGDGGADELRGGGGHNRLFGGDGYDFLDGTAGRDQLDGGRDNDRLDVHLDFGVYIQERGRSVIPASARAGADAGTDAMTVYLEVGPLYSSFITPVATTVQRATKSLEGLFKFLDGPVPVLSSLPAPFNGYQGKTLSAVLREANPGVMKAVDTIRNFNQLTFTDPASGSVPLAVYTLANGDQVTAGPGAYWMPPLSLLPPVLGKLHDYGFRFNVLENPNSAADLVLGRRVELISYTLPELNLPILDLTQRITFDLIPPTGVLTVNGILHEELRLTGHATFGFDTAGVQSGNFLDGFYMRDADLTLSATVWGESNLQVGWDQVANAKGGLKATGSATASAVLNDADGDGRIRINEIPSLDGAFTATAWLDYDVYVFVSADIGLKTFLTPNGIHKEWRLPIVGGHIPFGSVVF